jgi:hypothetical protein
VRQPCRSWRESQLYEQTPAHAADYTGKGGTRLAECLTLALVTSAGRLEDEECGVMFDDKLCDSGPRIDDPHRFRDCRDKDVEMLFGDINANEVLMRDYSCLPFSYGAASTAPSNCSRLVVGIAIAGN